MHYVLHNLRKVSAGEDYTDTKADDQSVGNSASNTSAANMRSKLVITHTAPRVHVHALVLYLYTPIWSAMLLSWANPSITVDCQYCVFCAQVGAQCIEYAGYVFLNSCYA